MKKGKRIVLTIIITYLLIMLGEMIYALINVYLQGYIQYATSLIIYEFISISISSFIFVFLYKGKSWAKWMTVIMLIWSALIARNQQHSNMKVYSLVIVGVYLVFSLILIYSKDVKMFMAMQRKKKVQVM